MPTDEEILDRMKQHCRNGLSLPEHKKEVIDTYQTETEKEHVRDRWNYVFMDMLKVCRVRLDHVSYQIVFSCPNVVL